MALGPSYKLPNNYMTFCPSYNLPNNRTKIRPRSTYLKILNLEGRLRNGKVLGTHSTQTKSSLLDSCDLCSFLCMSWMICWTCELKKKIKSHKFIYESVKRCLSLSIKECLSLEGERCAELWDASSIYRGWNAKKKKKQKTYGGKS